MLTTIILTKNNEGTIAQAIKSVLSLKGEVLVLDEPTVGVDPQSRNAIFEAIQKLNKEGMTIIYTTHYMEEAEKLCNQIAIIDNGKSIPRQGLP